MASIAAIADRRMSVGRVFSRAFATIGANPLTMFGIAFLFAALPSALLKALLRNGRATANAAFDPTAMLVGGVIALLTIAFGMLAQGALVRVTVAQSDGRTVGFGESAMAGLRKIAPLLILALLATLAVMMGILLLIVPGILLYVAWVVAAPALVEEKVGIFGAFGRSAFLTRGARWNVFAIQLVVLVIYWLVSLVTGIAMVLLFGVQGLAAAAQSSFSIVFLLLNCVSATILVTLVSAIQTSLYVELRDWKDGPATDALHDIFG